MFACRFCGKNNGCLVGICTNINIVTITPDVAIIKSIGKKISGANTLDNQVIGRRALRKLDGSGVNASINEKARVNGASATSDKLSNSADKYARGVKTRSLKDTEVSQKIHDHDHVYKPTSKVIEDAKQIMKKNK